MSLVRHTGCAGGADVLFYRVDGTYHSVPSKAAPDPGPWAASDARRNRDLETAEAVWAFFRDRRR